MTVEEIAMQLQRLALTEDFARASAELVEAWSLAQVGIEAVEPILRFMEEHPSIDFGMPGALVHFVERFYGKGYENNLIESVKKKPTPVTVWMLNRIINGAKYPQLKSQCIEIMKQIKANPLATEAVLEITNRFLQRLSA